MNRCLGVYLGLVILFLAVSGALAELPHVETLSLETDLPSGDYYPGEPMEIRCSLHNLSSATVVIPYRGIAEKNGFRLTIIGPDGEPVDHLPLHEGVPRPRWIEAGGCFTARFNLFDTHLMLSLGRYDIAVSFVSDGEYKEIDRTTGRRVTRSAWKGELDSHVGVATLLESTSTSDRKVLELLNANRSTAKAFGYPYSRLFLDRAQCERVIEEFPTSRYAQYARYYEAARFLSWFRKTGSQEYADKAQDLLAAINMEKVKPQFREQVDFFRLELLQAEGKSSELSDRFRAFAKQYPKSHRRIEDTDARYRQWKSLRQIGIRDPVAVIPSLHDFRVPPTKTVTSCPSPARPSASP